jgi:hypothetical protein
MNGMRKMNNTEIRFLTKEILRLRELSNKYEQPNRFTDELEEVLVGAREYEAEYPGTFTGLLR